MFWKQGHENNDLYPSVSGHNSIFKSYRVDSVVGIAVTAAIGFSSQARVSPASAPCAPMTILQWWKRNHNVHHIVTNAIEHDPDIQARALQPDPGRSADGHRTRSTCPS